MKRRRSNQQSSTIGTNSSNLNDSKCHSPKVRVRQQKYHKSKIALPKRLKTKHEFAFYGVLFLVFLSLIPLFFTFVMEPKRNYENRLISNEIFAILESIFFLFFAFKLFNVQKKLKSEYELYQKTILKWNKPTLSTGQKVIGRFKSPIKLDGKYKIILSLICTDDHNEIFWFQSIRAKKKKHQNGSYYTCEFELPTHLPQSGLKLGKSQIKWYIQFEVQTPEKTYYRRSPIKVRSKFEPDSLYQVRKTGASLLNSEDREPNLPHQYVRESEPPNTLIKYSFPITRNQKISVTWFIFVCFLFLNLFYGYAFQDADIMMAIISKVVFIAILIYMLHRSLYVNSIWLNQNGYLFQTHGWVWETFSKVYTNQSIKGLDVRSDNGYFPDQDLTKFWKIIAHVRQKDVVIADRIPDRNNANYICRVLRKKMQKGGCRLLWGTFNQQ